MHRLTKMYFSLHSFPTARARSFSERGQFLFIQDVRPNTVRFIRRFSSAAPVCLRRYAVHSLPFVAPSVVALDVEYIHFRGSPDDILVPGEVCIVNAHNSVVFHSFCRPGTSIIPMCARMLLETNTSLAGSTDLYRDDGHALHR